MESCSQPIGPPRKTGNGPKWGKEGFFPANPDLADILGRMDLDFEKFYVFHFLGSQISGLPVPQILDFPKIWCPDFQKSGFPGLQKIHTAAGPGTSPMLKTSVGIVSAWRFSFSVDFEFQRGKPDPIQFLKEMQ